MLNLILGGIAVVFSLLLASYALINRDCLSSVPLLFYSFVLSGVVDGGTAIMAWFGIVNLDIINIYFIVQFVLLYVLLTDIYSGRWFNRVLFILALGVLFFSIYETYDLFHKQKFTSKAIAMQCVFITLLSAARLIGHSLNTTNMLAKDAWFYFLSGLLLYYSISALTFGTAELVVKSVTIREFTWFINSVISIISNTILIAGIKWHRQTSSSRYI